MEIELKRNFGDEVWFLYENKVHCSKIYKVEHRRYTNFINYEIVDVEFYTVNVDESKIELTEDKVFSTKEELINSL